MKRWIVPALLLPGALLAQIMHIDLTGKPAVTIEHGFSNIAGVRELPNNLVIATDQMEHTVFLVDLTKRSARPLGSKGQGPLEYQFPMAPLAGAANGTWIFDATLRRFLIIGAGATLSNTVTLPATGLPGGLASARGTDQSGRIYFESNSFNSETGGFLDSVGVVRWDPVSNKSETLGKVWGGGRVKLMRNGVVVASLARGITPFPHLDSWAPLPDGRVAIVRHEPFQIDFIAAGRPIERGSALSYTLIKITSAEREAYQKRTTTPRTGALMIGGGVGPMGPGTTFTDEDFPAVMPAFVGSSVRTTPEGTIWIGRSFSSTDKTWHYDIHDGHGRLVGTATLNVNTVVVGFGPKSIYVARTNPDDDLIYLERYTR